MLTAESVIWVVTRVVVFLFCRWKLKSCTSRIYILVNFEVLTPILLKIKVFWDFFMFHIHALKNVCTINKPTDAHQQNMFYHILLFTDTQMVVAEVTKTCR